MMQLRVNGRKKQLLSLRKAVYSIGSSSACDLYFPDKSLEPVHAHLTLKGGWLSVMRRGDAVVEVNGVALKTGRVLRADDNVRLGNLELEVVSIDQPVEQEDLPVNSNDEPVPGWVLHAVNLSRTKSYKVEGSMLVGRGSECDIRLGEAHLSRRHARFRATERRLVVEDLGSANGTFVNGKRVTRALLHSGDELSFDNLRFRIVHTANRDDSNETSLRPPAINLPPQSARPTAIEVQRETLRRLNGESGPHPETSSTPGASAGIMEDIWPALVMAVTALGVLIWGLTSFIG